LESREREPKALLKALLKNIAASAVAVYNAVRLQSIDSPEGSSL